MEASDVELADDEHRAPAASGPAQPVPPERLEVTISVRFTTSEIAALRSRAEAAGMEPTTYVRRLVLATEEPPLDRDHLTRLLDALTRDLDDLRHAIM
jgi:hypothetical protein